MVLVQGLLNFIYLGLNLLMFNLDFVSLNQSIS